MTPKAIPTSQTTTNLYELALLLAEGQTGDAAANWDAFIDNLSRITDAFAESRARAQKKRHLLEALIPA